MPEPISDVPACLAHLPRYGDLPVPFFTAIHRDGRPNFRAHDPARHNLAMSGRICGICGKGLGYWLCFVAGPLILTDRASYMPASHRECALAALAICPYLALEDRDRSAKPVPVRKQIVPREDLPSKPTRLALVTTREYTTFRGPAQQLYARFAAPKRIEWWSYVNGQLTPEEEKRA